MSWIEQLETFIQDLDREAYQVGAGLKEEANFSEIFNKAGSLISSETIEAIRAAGIEEWERAEYLSFLLSMIMDNRMKEMTDKVITMELEAEVEVAGEKLPFRQLQVEIANEKDHLKRDALNEARMLGQEKLNGICADIMNKSHETVMEFGYGNYIEFFEAVEGVSLSTLRLETEKLLSQTEAFYLRELKHYSETFLKMPVEDLKQYDLVYMRRADLFDDLFPQEKLLDAAWATTDAMEIAAREHPHITLDIEHRPGKDPRAFCCPVRVPEEVYLVIMPHGGVDDYSSFLHELGHTLHYAHTSPGMPLAARHLGDNSVTEAHAGTLEHLIFSREWLRRRLGVDDASEYLRFMRFFELYMLRRYSGKLHYEMELHGGRPLSECGDIYAETLSSATFVKYDPVYYLQDVDNHFYCARYLRAWMLERQIRSRLETDFGTAWFESPDAGEFLLKLWSRGQRYKADAVSAAMGFDSLDFDNIISDYAAG